MKIKTLVIVTLTSIVFLLLVLSVSSYLAMNKNSQITNYYPSDLLPAIRFFEKLRLDTAQLELAVYQKDKATIDRLGKDLEKRLIFFGGGGTATDDSPFKDDDFVNNGVKEVADAMLVLVRAAMEQNLNQPLSQTYKNAEKRQKVVEQKSEEVISYIVKETTSLISNGMNGIKNIILTIAVISLLISLLLGWKLFNSIDKGMSGLIVSFEKISKGDLTASADESSKDEFGELASYFNKLGRSLKTTIEELMVTVKQLSSLSNQFKETGDVFVRSSEQTSNETNLLATAMTEMSATANEVAKNAENTSTQAQQASDQVGSVNQLINKTVLDTQNVSNVMVEVTEQVLQLKDKAVSISSVVDVIQGIAEQTNLLALNAAIEAARAGEQGRGFAVVADEVRSLANRTGESTKEISKVIEELQNLSETTTQQIELSNNSVQNNADAIKEIEVAVSTILENINAITDMNHTVATNATEQSHVAEEINVNVVRISQLSDENMNETQKINQEIDSVDGLAKSLQVIVNKFSI